MNTKLHSTSSASQCVRVARYVYTSVVITEMSKMPCKKYLSCSADEKRNLSKCVEDAEN
jgi:hypothetical protein